VAARAVAVSAVAKPWSVNVLMVISDLSWQATIASLLRRSGAVCDGSIAVARA